MEENNNINKEQQTEEKKFTQAEVDEIVKNRLGRERRKQGEDMEANFAARELQLTAKEKLLDLGLPRKWAELLRYDSKETLDSVLSELQALIGRKKKKASRKKNGVKAGGKGKKEHLKKMTFGRLSACLSKGGTP